MSVLSRNFAHHHTATSDPAGTATTNMARSPDQSPPDIREAPVQNSANGTDHDQLATADTIGSATVATEKFRSRAALNGHRYAAASPTSTTTETTASAAIPVPRPWRTPEASGQCQSVACCKGFGVPGGASGCRPVNSPVSGGGVVVGTGAVVVGPQSSGVIRGTQSLPLMRLPC
ncbi:hypothetical protein GCM10010198_67640 [Nocardia seriolae]|nr:hypothetical protein NSERKGN1266_31520 [Nocardia seriolae]BEK97029.1 hypothetical protein NSER024013_49350 [Nocardia seriolae]